MLNEDLLEHAGQMLQFLDAIGLGPEWREHNAAAGDPEAQRQIVSDIRMRLSPRL